jgi:hypothetical protein
MGKLAFPTALIENVLLNLHSSVWTTAEVYAHAIRGQDDEVAVRWDEFQRRGTGDRLQRKLQ